MDIFGTLKDVSQLVKKYNDIELMKRIVELQSQVFDLQQTNLRLQEELSQIKQESADELAMQMSGPMNYYFRKGDPVPFCPKCWGRASGRRYTFRKRSHGAAEFDATVAFATRPIGRSPRSRLPSESQEDGE